MGHPRPLFGLFSSFQTNNTIFITNKCEKCPSSTQCWDSNPRPLEHDSSRITTRHMVHVAILPNVLNHHSLVSKPLWHSFLQSWISTINTFISSSLRRASTWPRIARSCQTTTISSSTCSSRKRSTLNFELMTKRPSLRRYFEARLLWLNTVWK